MIPDSHIALTGIKPVLFSVGGVAVTSYAVFMILGVAAAIAVFWQQSRQQGPANPQAWTIMLSALFFGSLGAKLLAVALHAGHYHEFGFTEFLYAGRSIVGGLLGGWAGVKLAKWYFGIKTRHGNAIAPAAALGIAIGRVGCFLGSCCYGKPTSGPFGVEFGDGPPRPPTQLYEAAFALGLCVYFLRENTRHPPPGVLFQRFLLAYLGFRFLIEFIRVEPICGCGLTVFQVLCLLGIFLLAALQLSTSLRPSSPSRGEL